MVMWFNPQMELCEKQVTVKQWPREDLGYAVYEEYNKELETSMLAQGMKFPLIVIRNTEDNWYVATKGLKSGMNYDASVHYLVVYGNQRLRVLDNHKVLEIPIIIAEDHDEAIVIHSFFKNQV